MTQLPVTLSDIRAAAERVRRTLIVTPLTHSPVLSEKTSTELYCKWDNKFRTGSFKERGAVNIVEIRKASGAKGGICAASAGNHALSLSYHAARAKVPCTIVMPISAPLVKVQSTQNTGAEVILHGTNFDEAYTFCQRMAQERKLDFIPGFDDPRVIAGQGTCGLEIMEQLPDCDSIVVPCGGGGLVAGIALVAKSINPDIFILGVQSEWATQVLPTLRAEKKPTIVPATIAEGIALGIGKTPRPIIDAHVDKLVSVSESQIARAIVNLVEVERAVVEGAGAAGLAGILAGHLPSHCKKTVVTICGSNIDINVLSRLLERDMGARGRILRVEVSVPDRPGSLFTTTGIVARAGANILQVIHDRSFSRLPGNVDITLELEVRNADHKQVITRSLKEAGIEVRELPSPEPI